MKKKKEVKNIGHIRRKQKRERDIEDDEQN